MQIKCSWGREGKRFLKKNRMECKNAFNEKRDENECVKINGAEREAVCTEI